jgi:hypothetical protein
VLSVEVGRGRVCGDSQFLPEFLLLDEEIVEEEGEFV